MVQREVIKILKEYLHILEESGIYIQKAFLYGSYARNDANEQSDIDVMLISEIFDKNDDKQIGKIWRLTTKINTRIEPYTVGINRFLKDDVSPLLEIVRREGIEIKT